MHGWYGGFGWVGMILGGLILLALLTGLILVILFGILQVRKGSGHSNVNPAGQSEPSAREILQARYARGEITREQYLQMLTDIEV